MVGTIAPVVDSDTSFGKFRWTISAGIYTLGSMVGGGLTGALLASLGGLTMGFFGPHRDLVLFIIGVLSIFYALHEMGIVSLPHPQMRKQVPARWRYRLHPYLASGLYGLILGAGFATFVPTTSYYILLLTATLSGSPITGVLLLSVYGAARALLLWPSSFTATTVDAWEKLANFVKLTKPVMRQVNGFGLALVGAGLMLGI